MKLSFGRRVQGKKLDVNKCGVRLVYEKEQRDGECSFRNSNSIASVFLIAQLRSTIGSVL